MVCALINFILLNTELTCLKLLNCLRNVVRLPQNLGFVFFFFHPTQHELEHMPKMTKF